MKSKILIADNDQEICQNLFNFLTSKGYDCVVTGDGEEAVDLVQQDNFDILIVDIKMPKWNGIEILEKIQKFSPRTLTLITTAPATIESAIEALRHGATDYLLKPLDFEDLLVRINGLRIKEAQPSKPYNLLSL